MLTNITIDNDTPFGTGSMTWATAATKPWCKGSGTPGNPYVIENVSINGQSLRSCINITDSNKYFEINNCTVYNSRSGGNYAGIYLKGVENGTLTNNNCSFNHNYGIHLDSCTNITIINNSIIKNNTVYGILLNSSSSNEISKNIISFCESGIYIDEHSGNNNISYNTIYNSSINGIFLNSVGGNNITNNNIFNSLGNGIGLIDNTYPNIEKNIIHDIKGNGIELVGSLGGFSSNIKILSNKIYNNSESGLFINTNGQKLDIINNEIKNNGHYGLYMNRFKTNTEDFKRVNIERNLIDYNGYINLYQKNGICFDESSGIFFKRNTVSNNNMYGINVTSSCDEIHFYNNTFINQKVHAYDIGRKGVWDNELYLGNYWDNYIGKDFNDDGFGDSVYYLVNGIDHYPIWWDAPVISNVRPVQGTEYSTSAPEYEIQISEGLGEVFWYEIVGIGKNMSYTDLDGYFGEKTTGTINQTLWNSLPQGKVTIKFYVNDSRGWIANLDVEVTKYIPASPVTIILSEGGGGGGGDEEEEDPYFWLIRAAIGGAISASVGVVIKQSYSTVKKKRQLYELISKKLDEIEKLEQFFKANLGKVDWESFQPVYKDYTKRKISQKDLIKEGKKSMGKSFTELFVPKAKRKFIR